MDAIGQVLHVVGTEVAKMWWIVVLAVSLAALIKTQQLDRKMRTHIGRFGFWAIPAAVAIGLLSPLCSCGILPVVIPLALTGVPLAPLMALLVTSPIMDPTSFILTWGALGPELAWWKLGGAIFLGLSAGIVTWIFERTGFFSGNLVRLSPVYKEDGTLATAYEIGCANGFLLKTMKVVPRDSKWRFFLDRFRDVGVFVFPVVGLAIVLEALLQVFVPIGWVTALAGTKGVTSIAVATVIGLPMPLHQVPIVPILAGLQAKGLAVGADIAFLMAGPVTSIPSIFALWAIFKPRVVVTFLCIGLFGSALLGFARMIVAG
jgi:uncharacterized membrane protein YraQ (UPF0718 family)